jgi:hypothetical protein
MTEAASAAYQDSTKGLTRRRALIHPLIMDWMRHFNGPEVWHDRSAIADTERQAPKLFLNN